MNKQIKRYLVDELDSELTAVSLVDAPAIESNYQYFSKEKPRYVSLESDEKRLVIGAALIPDLDIYRYDEWTGEEFYINFSRKCIENLADKFMKENRGHNWTLDHQKAVENIYVFESWIKEDMERDKSVALGLPADLPVGTWFLSARINDNETWERVKDGRWHGFSVEAFVSLNELKFNKEKNKNNEEMTEINETFWERLKNVFTEVLCKQEEVVEQPVEEKLEEDVKQDEPEATVTEADGEGVAETVLEGEPEHVEEAEPDEATVEQVEATQHLESEDLNARVADLESKLAKVLEQNAELKKENEKLSAQPSVKPINAKSEKRMDTMDIIRSLHEGTYAK